MPPSIRPFHAPRLIFPSSTPRSLPSLRLHQLTRQFSRSPAAMAPSSTSLAIIAGVGPGTGASVARKFAETYPVVLLARNPANYEELVKEITAAGGKAVGISTDVSDEASVANAFSEIKALGGGADTKVAAAVFNVGGGFVRKPFLELKLADFEGGWGVSGRGAFLFSHAALPLLLNAVPPASTTTASTVHPPTLIFTGATASVKSNALMSSFAAGKWAQRALAQSLGREFGPKGVHVAHVIVDGIIDIERTKAWGSGEPDSKISPAAIADQYWYLHTQPRTMFTHELDIRPYIEKW